MIMAALKTESVESPVEYDFKKQNTWRFMCFSF